MALNNLLAASSALFSCGDAHALGTWLYGHLIISYDANHNSNGAGFNSSAPYAEVGISNSSTHYKEQGTVCVHQVVNQFSICHSVKITLWSKSCLDISISIYKYQEDDKSMGFTFRYTVEFTLSAGDKLVFQTSGKVTGRRAWRRRIRSFLRFDRHHQFLSLSPISIHTIQLIISEDIAGVFPRCAYLCTMCFQHRLVLLSFWVDYNNGSAVDVDGIWDLCAAAVETYKGSASSQ